ncbi:MAG: hypothetical protein LBG10_07735, partial [Treponema sp.]|nr:hypothetical protein [Treponema sp.]
MIEGGGLLVFLCGFGSAAFRANRLSVTPFIPKFPLVSNTIPISIRRQYASITRRQPAVGVGQALSGGFYRFFGR